MTGIKILDHAFDPWVELAEYKAQQSDAAKTGATSVFIGTMRDFNEGDSVSAMMLEHYPGMTDSYLAQLRDQAIKRWALLDGLIIHRVGDIQPADDILLVAVWSAHRKAAFESGRFLVEELKHKAPFWKKEKLCSGESRWISKNTAG